MAIDPYVYPGTEILINKFDCRDQKKLNEREADFTILKLASLSTEPLLGDYNAFSKSLAHLWRVHPFREGNTRTITHFCCQYYDNQNVAINRKLFEENAAYLRSSLVAASAVFSDLGDRSDYSYLLRIVSDAIGV